MIFISMEYIRDDEFLNRFGNRLRTIRKSQGFTQEKLAFELGIEVSQISRIERGLLNTSISNVHLIAQKLGVKTSFLFDL